MDGWSISQRHRSNNSNRSIGNWCIYWACAPKQLSFFPWNIKSQHLQCAWLRKSCALTRIQTKNWRSSEAGSQENDWRRQKSWIQLQSFTRSWRWEVENLKRLHFRKSMVVLLEEIISTCRRKKNKELQLFTFTISLPSPRTPVWPNQCKWGRKGRNVKK